MNGFEIAETLTLFVAIRFIVPVVLVVSIGNFLKKAQPV